MKITTLFFAIVFCTGILSCKKTFINPNAPEIDPLLKTPEGMVQLLVGIKNRFAVNSNYGNGAVFNSITANGFSSNEINLKAGGNQDFGQLAAGRNTIATNNVVLTELWSNCMLINNYSTMLLDNVDQVVQDSGMKINILKYAYLYKALSIGILANYWKEFPVSTGTNASFVSKDDGLKRAISFLETAVLLPTKSAPPEYSVYFGSEINVNNTCNALLARYYNMLGDSIKAVEKASKVIMNNRSVFIYNAQNTNPLYRSGYTFVFGYTPKGGFGLPASLAPSPADARIAFYLVPQGPQGQPPGFGFGKTDFDSIPIFLPGEMLLIQAEAYVRRNDLINGKKFLDSVLRKKNVEDVFRVGANLPAYSGPLDSASLMKEIYKNRCIELFLSGMKLEDGRRFRRPGPTDPNSERTRDWYPYPLVERNGNPNTPIDPTN